MLHSNSHFHYHFYQLRTNLWYANRYHLENEPKFESLYTNWCVEHCLELSDIDDEEFRREIYPFLPTFITDKILYNQST